MSEPCCDAPYPTRANDGPWSCVHCGGPTTPAQAKAWQAKMPARPNKPYMITSNWLRHPEAGGPDE